IKVEAVMHVPEKIRRCVIFLGSKNERGVFIPRGTAFLVDSHSKGDAEVFPHIVTAEHVISGMLTKGIEIYARVNLKPDWSEKAGEGFALMPLKGRADWYFHPDAASQATDVAVATVGLNRGMADHDFMPLLEYAWSDVDPSYNPRPPGLGDEV